MPGPERRLAAILSADIAGYSRLMAEDEDETIRLVTARRQQVGLLLEQHRGRLVDFTGDNFLAEFGSAVNAVECAVEIQGVGRALNAALPSDRRMEFRIGVHLGEVQAQDGRLFGTGVNIAARLEALADPGGICASAEVHREVANRTRFEFRDLGAQEVKNIPEPVHAYAVEVPEALATPVPARHPESRIAMGIGALVLLVAAGWWALQGDEPVSVAKLPTSLVVLPFDDLSRDGDQEYFAHGMSEELTSRLAEVRELRVLGRTTAEVVKQRRLTVAEIGELLSVEAVIEGSVRRDGDRLRVTVQLIRVDDGSHLWSRSYDQSARGVFEVQDQIARAVAAAVGIHLAPAAARVQTDDSLRAHELYLLGRHHFNQRTEASLRKAIEYLSEASALDDSSALAHSALADARLQLWNYAPSGDPADLEAGVAAAERAVALGKGVAAAHTSLGLARAFQWKWSEGESEIQRALELNPDYAPAHSWYGVYVLQPKWDLDGAIEALGRAALLDPLSASTQMSLGNVHLSRGSYGHAVRHLERALELSPDYSRARDLLLLAYHASGRGDEAMAFATGAFPSEVGSRLVAAYESDGLVGFVSLMLSMERKASGKHCTRFPARGADLLLLMGDGDGALGCLELAYESRTLQSLPRARPPHIPKNVWGPYRNDPRFQAILEGMGLAD